MPRRIPLFQRLLLELQANCNRSCFFCNRPGDDSGKRIRPDGGHVTTRMPTDHALRILDEAAALGFRGRVAFHHMSEPFLDPRIIDMAHAARARGMRPYEHTNGDVLRNNPDLCAAAVSVFEYIVVGLYDYETDEELRSEMAFWQARLRGTDVRFSTVGRVFPRNLTPHTPRMFRPKEAHGSAPCARPLLRLIVHYDGNIALCCEDMRDQFGLGNAFDTPIRELWYSDRHQETVRALLRGERHKYDLCANCPMPASATPSFAPATGAVATLRRRLRTFLPS